MVKRYTTDEVYWAFDHAGANATKFVLASEYDALEDDYEDVITELKSARDALARMKQASDYNAAELARVKAESLRVVPVSEADSGLMYDWYMTPTGLGYPGKDRKNNNCIESAEGYYRLDECQPVRLERWEDGK